MTRTHKKTRTHKHHGQHDGVLIVSLGSEHYMCPYVRDYLSTYAHAVEESIGGIVSGTVSYILLKRQ
jgi:hypothetical protein